MVIEVHCPAHCTYSQGHILVLNESPCGLPCTVLDQLYVTGMIDRWFNLAIAY
jgi:hypothetical protein